MCWRVETGTDNTHTQSTAGVVVVLCSRIIFIPQEKKRWRNKEERAWGRRQLINYCRARQERKIQRREVLEKVQGYDPSPAPALHFNCTEKLTILPKVPHSSALDDTTPFNSSPLNHCTPFLKTDSHVQNTRIDEHVWSWISKGELQCPIVLRVRRSHGVPVRTSSGKQNCHHSRSI